MKETIEKNKKIVDRAQLCEIFYSGIKPKNDFKLGIEYEKLAIRSKSFKAVSYSESNGIRDLLKKFQKTYNCEEIKENNNLLGLKIGKSELSLEPGAQLEVSLCPYQTIHECKAKIDSYNQITNELAEEMGIFWLGYGIQPFSTYEKIELIPKTRYKLMDNYFRSIKTTAQIMMRETAGIQLSIDYDSEEDAMQKLRTATFLSPIVSAMFANSPIRNGKLSNYRSYRTNSWLCVDEHRCGLIDSRLFHKELDFSFEDYCNLLLKKPAVFIEKTGKNTNLSFDELIRKDLVNIDDWHTHLSLYFPDVRLRNVIEIRNCDCQQPKMIYAFMALWKGLLYSKEASEAAFETIEELNWISVNILRKITPHSGLNINFLGVNLFDVANELIQIAKLSLKQQSEEHGYPDESYYLEALEEYGEQKLTPADVIANKWQYKWNKDPAKLVEYIKII